MNLKTLRKAPGKKYLMDFRIPWSELLVSATRNWPKISGEDPTDKDLKDLAYKFALSSTPRGFDLVAQYCRAFQDSSIECTFTEAEEVDGIPTNALYKIKLIVVCEDMETDQEQAEKNVQYYKDLSELQINLTKNKLTWE